MSNLSIKRIVFGVSFFVLAGLVLTAFLFWRGFFIPLSANGEEVLFEIKEGWGVKTIAIELEDEKLIKNALYFDYYVWGKKWGGELQAGVYRLSPAMNIAQIAEKFRAGEVFEDIVTVTIPPGQRISKVNKIFQEAGFAQKPDLLKFKVKDFSKEFSFLKGAPQEGSLEGFLYPETLNFRKEASSEEIVEKILGVFEKNIDAELRRQVEEKGMNLYKILTLASIVEQEVPASKAEDRKMVAGIFWNRLEIGQPLESCVTIEYLLGVHKNRYSFEDTRTVSPYNTYINPGLPPTPIASPRKDAVEATVDFQESDFLFFLSRPDTGETVFSKTFKEHEMNVEKHL